MNGITIKPGWADNLKEGSPVIVRSGTVSSKRPSTGYKIAKVDRVTATEIHVDGRRYRYGKGSKYVEYQNEGLDIDMLSDPSCGAIFPAIAATRRWLKAARAADAAADDLVLLTMNVRNEVTAAFERGATDRLSAAYAALTQ